MMEKILPEIIIFYNFKILSNSFIMKNEPKKSCCQIGGPATGEILLRIALGSTIALMGLGKFIGGVVGFVENFSDKFVDSFVPMFLVTPVLWIIPVAELLIGLWLLSGFKRVGALLAYGILMIVFALGHLLMGDHDLTGIFVYLIATGGTLFLTSRSGQSTC